MCCNYCISQTIVAYTSVYCIATNITQDLTAYLNGPNADFPIILVKHLSTIFWNLLFVTNGIMFST